MSFEVVEKKLSLLSVRSSKFTLAATPEYFSKIENEIGVNLPTSYQWFLSKYSLSRISAVYPLLEVKYKDITQETVEVFYGASSRESDDLFECVVGYRDRMPKSVIPIASDAGDNQVCLGVVGDVKGKVFFWEFEKEVTETEPDFSNMSLIANSFEEFILSMRSRSDK